MNYILNHSSMVPIYEQLTEQIKAAATSGDLKEGDALPSVRTLAAELRISALTVKKAYDRLEEEGIIVTVHGKGSYIAKIDPSSAREARLVEIQGLFADAVDRAVSSGMTGDEIRELMEILLEDIK